MNTVTFGKRERLKFIAGGTLEQWQPPQGPVIYALTFKQDAHMRPKAHTVAYFGETEDFSQPSIRNELNKWWDENSGHRGELYIFFHPMPGSSQHERAKIMHQLTLEYEPKGNE
jgi:hypothetical protein